ncbi:MAG: sulfotransferase [Chitinophagales bacterium]|nr:sulfotransferase [Chitinophagales bacterium]MDW8427896.1 sulfotransferase [Chitinophagales bacterium]
MNMIFVVGNSRSGTTMMGRILNNHPRIHTFPELHFFEQLWSTADRQRRLNKDEAARLAALLLNIAREGYFARRHIEDYLAEAKKLLASSGVSTPLASDVFAAVVQYETRRLGKEMGCDQTPQNVFYIKEILELFPESRFINMVRDPRDVLLSQKRKWRRRFLGGTHATWYETVRAWVNYHPYTISRLWVAAVRAARRMQHPNVLTVQFERLLAHPDDVIAAVCAHVGVDFLAAMKEVPQVGSSSGHDRSEVKGINAERAQSWKRGGLSPTELWICQKVCCAQMEAFGYKPVDVRPDPLLLLWYVFLWPLKLAAAFIMNLHRMKNIMETLKKRLS